MSTVLFIFGNIVLPIALLISVGFVARRKLALDTGTFSRLTLHVLIPVVLFLKIYEYTPTPETFAMILLYIFCVEAFLLLAGEAVSRILHYPRSTRKTFDNLLLFFNSGNYGIPLIDLSFRGNPIAMASQTMIVVVQNIAANTFGVFQASSGKSHWREALKSILRTPLLYALAAALLVKAVGLRLPEMILTPAGYLSNTFVGVALLNLGAQLSEVRLRFRLRDVLSLSVIRLLLAPAAGCLLALALGLKGVLAQSLIVGVATPSAVNASILAREYDCEPEFAAKGVFATTVLSAVTVPVVIYLAGRLF